MGKSSIIIVLGTMLLVSFLVLKLNGNSKQNLSTTVDMFNQTQSRLIANTGVEIYLEKLYKDPSLLGSTHEESLFGGKYKVTISGVLPNVRVISRANFQGVSHTSVADAFLTQIYFPNPPGGIYISSNAVVDAKELGDMKVDGREHYANGDVDSSGQAVWSVAVDNSIDRDNILKSLLKPANLFGLKDSATGAVGYPSVGVTPLGEDWARMYQFLANAADQTFINDIPSGTNLGTIDAPRITLVNADAADGKDIIINGNAGAGIMIVNGNIKFAGNFNYTGIILCYKNTDMTFSSTGTNEVVGGIVVAGTNVDFGLNGTMNVKHSQDAVDKVKARLKQNGFKILSWYE